ncbi:hypothetical protein B0T22DRAFT_9372 [Podospora appendiculata]|uniref:Uncharacterized protein n=1 Tax=Podospora appendiculata TaxID=314037 RepID=A0AAE0XF74_9PEZI|nr:hypothetical protein B0T22DRAFT_9372 [Podospora appendiculata]
MFDCYNGLPANGEQAKACIACSSRAGPASGTPAPTRKTEMQGLFPNAPPWPFVAVEGRRGMWGRPSLCHCGGDPDCSVFGDERRWAWHGMAWFLRLTRVTCFHHGVEVELGFGFGLVLLLMGWLVVEYIRTDCNPMVFFCRLVCGESDVMALVRCIV